MGEPAVLFYCQHVLGGGHRWRSRALARALARRFRVVFLNGGAVPRGLPRPPGIEFVDLPPLGFDVTGRLVSRDSRRSVERALRERRETILRTFHRLQPHAVVVELFPFGRKKFAEELLPLFEEVRALGAQRPLLVSSLRDILATGRRDQARHDDRACMLANRYLDAILVHADPRFARLEESFRPEQELRVPVHSQGFVISHTPRTSPRSSPAPRRRSASAATTRRSKSCGRACRRSSCRSARRGGTSSGSGPGGSSGSGRCACSSPSGSTVRRSRPRCARCSASGRRRSRST